MIIRILSEYESLTYSELEEMVAKQPGDQFEELPSWYDTTVKLDLEARGVVERIDGKEPQMLQINQYNKEV